MRRTEARSIFVNLRPVFVAFFLIAIIVGSGYVLGTSQAAQLKDAGQWETIQMRVTAYCPCSKCCGDSSDGITANGHNINQGDRFVAADKKYPFGTKMIIPGYNSSQTVEVIDRGGAIYGNRLDVFFNSHQEALEWGVRHLDVKIFVQ